MRVAVVHDFLSQRGGAERVVLHLARRLPDPTIFTSLYAPEDTYPEFREHRVIASRRASGSEAKRFRSRALSYPVQFRDLDLSRFDLVIVSSSSFAHHVRHPHSAVYWHTPPRFLYDPGAYFSSRVAARALSLGLRPLRRPDREAAQRHILHAANSKLTSSRLKACYGIDAPVLHPPLDASRLDPDLKDVPGYHRALVVSRLLPYKHLDIAIKACKSIGVPLTIVGDGPERQRLLQLSDGWVNFVSALSDEELSRAYSSHSVVLCPGADDFGYIPLEAGYAGRPVVAFGGAGAAETVLDGETGMLVNTWDISEWEWAISSVLRRSWDPLHLRTSMERFSGDRFDAGLSHWLQPLVGDESLLTETPAPLAEVPVIMPAPVLTAVRPAPTPLAPALTHAATSVRS